MLKEIIQPHRVHASQPDYVAHQMCQRLEWRCDLHWKSYNHLCSVGHIPADHMMMLKMHPDSQVLMSGVLALRESIQKDTDRFLTLDKTTVLMQVARDEKERAAIFDRNVMDENRVLASDNIPRIQDNSFKVEQVEEGVEGSQ